MFRYARLLAATAATALLAAPAALADPPSHAPAHGWRAKHDAYYVGYTGNQWERDYGVSGGECNRDEIGTVVGAVIGGAVGSTVGEGDSKLIAILAGSAIGAVIGREIGRDMDERDRACIGHTLELARDGQQIRWDGPRTGLAFAVTPTAGFERDGYACRRFVLERLQDGHGRNQRGAACRVNDGEWQLL